MRKKTQFEREKLSFIPLEGIEKPNLDESYYNSYDAFDLFFFLLSGPRNWNWLNKLLRFLSFLSLYYRRL